MEEQKKESGDASRKIIEKAKEFADKAEDMMEDTVEKIRNSETFKKAENFIEEKMDELEESNISEKLKKFADQIEDKAEDLLEKAKVQGKKIADKADDLADDVADRFRRNTPKSNT